MKYLKFFGLLLCVLISAAAVVVFLLIAIAGPVAQAPVPNACLRSMT